MDILAWPKQHPWTTAGIAVAAVGAIYLLSVLSSSGGATVTQGTSTGVDALTLQQDAESANASAQSSAQNFTLAENAQQIGGQLGIAQLQLTGAQDQIAASLQANTDNNALAAYQTSVGADVQNNATAANLSAIEAQLNQQVQINASNNATSLGLANINANTQIQQANDFTQLEQTIATTQAAVTEAQTNATVQIAGINAQVSEKAIGAQQSNGLLGFFGGILGGLL